MFIFDFGQVGGVGFVDDNFVEEVGMIFDVVGCVIVFNNYFYDQSVLIVVGENFLDFLDLV